MEKIHGQPIIGNGLADSISVYSPIFKKEISTPNFDWGYLELWDELGIIGLLAWLSLMVFSLKKLYQSKIVDKEVYVSMIVSLLIINITSPALFHVMGVLLITSILIF